MVLIVLEVITVEADIVSVLLVLTTHHNKTAWYQQNMDYTLLDYENIYYPNRNPNGLVRVSNCVRFGLGLE